MCAEGHTGSITNVDISAVITEYMRDKHADLPPSVTWEVGDVTRLVHGDSTFDAAIDKGTMDALMVRLRAVRLFAVRAGPAVRGPCWSLLKPLACSAATTRRATRPPWRARCCVCCAPEACSSWCDAYAGCAAQLWLADCRQRCTQITYGDPGSRLFVLEPLKWDISVHLAGAYRGCSVLPGPRFSLH
jgi:hypothetical protein